MPRPTKVRTQNHMLHLAKLADFCHNSFLAWGRCRNLAVVWEGPAFGKGHDCVRWGRPFSGDMCPRREAESQGDDTVVREGFVWFWFVLRQGRHKISLCQR